VSSPSLKNLTNANPVGPFAQYLQEVFYGVYSHVTCGVRETSKTRNTKKAKNGRNNVRENNEKPNNEM